ncbi:MAG: NAD(P) transhydrogenase subunit alpha [Lentimonas sp.]|jgi:NAD(P) transhydrogenase subunit alpha
MKILVLKESIQGENRVAVTPDLISKYGKMGYEILIESKAGENSGISNEVFQEAGASIVEKISDVIADIDIILKVQAPTQEEFKDFEKHKKDVVLVGLLNPNQNKSAVEFYKNSGIKAFATELFPRITRAQSMDTLSSQSNLVGYRSVIDGVSQLTSAVPMMMTAAGTVTPAKILILGAGVAGLQAIATAKRLGGVVSAFDVRAAAKEQVQSLGGKFIEVEAQEDGQTKEGYAKEMSEEYKNRQTQVIFDNIIKQDLVIATALIPGRPAPKLITEEMVKNMKTGSVIVDIAAVNGGNCELTEPGKVVVKFGVTIIGHNNFPSRIASDASKLYSKNLYNFVELLTNKEEEKVEINLEDEITKASLC